MASHQKINYIPVTKYPRQMDRTLDTGYQVDCVYMDYAKAFDTVPHRYMITKWQVNRINEEILTWIKIILSDSIQQVVVHGAEAT